MTQNMVIIRKGFGHFFACVNSGIHIKELGPRLAWQYLVSHVLEEPCLSHTVKNSEG